MAPILRGFTLALLALTLIACSSSDDDDSGDANVLPEFQEPSTTCLLYTSDAADE